VPVPVPTSRALVVRALSERGQTAAEYLGVLHVVSVIIAAVATTDMGHDITTRLSELVQDISGGKSGK
jgi:Flp pilus assembly pilin Flp